MWSHIVQIAVRSKKYQSNIISSLNYPVRSYWLKKSFFARWFVLTLSCYKLKRETYYSTAVYKLEDGDVY